MISQVSMTIVRQMMHTVKWERQLVSIRGSRGVGKTTLMRQYIRLVCLSRLNGVSYWQETTYMDRRIPLLILKPMDHPLFSIIIPHKDILSISI